MLPLWVFHLSCFRKCQMLSSHQRLRFLSPSLKFFVFFHIEKKIGVLDETGIAFHYCHWCCCISVHSTFTQGCIRLQDSTAASVNFLILLLIDWTCSQSESLIDKICLVIKVITGVIEWKAKTPNICVVFACCSCLAPPTTYLTICDGGSVRALIKVYIFL